MKRRGLSRPDEAPAGAEDPGACIRGKLCGELQFWLTNTVGL